MVLLSTRLTEIRAFSDLFAEFQAALEESALPLSTKMVFLCNRPTYEFIAFQVQMCGLGDGFMVGFSLGE